jgi:tetratricopeptide (TPR) repeat protein
MALTTHLAALEASGLIRLAQVQPEVEYLFRHALVQDAAYASLLKADRRILHRAVGEALERLYPDRLDGLAFVLGQHFREAGETDRARGYFIRAGDIARRQYANREAIAAYTEALALTTDDAGRFDLLAARAAVCDVIAARDEQRADVDAMLALAEKLDDDARRCDALIALADFYLKTEHLRSREPAERAAEIARTLDDKLREGRALRCLGEGAFDRRDLAQSRSALEAAVVRFREAGQPGEAAACLNWLALVLGELNELPASQKAAEEAVVLSRAAGDRRQEAINLRRLATMHSDLNQYAEALPFAEAALALNRQLGDRANECHALNVLGTIHSGLQQMEKAKAHYRESLEIAEAIHLQVGVRLVVNNLTEMHESLGEHEAGLAFLETQLVKAQRINDEYLAAEFQIMQAYLFARMGQFARALELWRATLEIRERLAGPVAGVLSNIGRMQAEAGQFAQARQTLTIALERAHETGSSYLAVHILSNSAYVAWLEGGPDEMRSGLAQAKQALALPAQWKDPLWIVFALTTAARLCLALGEVDEALSYSAEAVRLMETTPESWEMEQSLFIHSRALRANGRRAEADEHLRRAYDRVMLVASKTQDPELRRSWLENVRDNRETVAEWESRKHGGFVA